MLRLACRTDRRGTTVAAYGKSINLALLLIAIARPTAGEGLIWESWDRRQTCRPLDYHLPSTEAEVVAAVKEANAANATLKVVGAGHSFSAIALGDPLVRMLSLDRMDKILHVDGTLVTVAGGIRLHDLNAQLEDHGLALANLGATCEQSLAGATATGTHGTGRLLGSVSTAIEGMRIVVANGSVVDASATQHVDLFAAARVGLGALGVVTQLSIRTLPLYYLRLNNTQVPLDELLAQLPSLTQQYERLQWFWEPPDEQHATLVTREVVPGPPSAGGGCWAAAAHPADPAAPGDTSCVDVAYKALCGSPAHYAARVLYTEMEMFVPTAQAPAAVAAFRAYQAAVAPRHNASVPLFTGVRYVAADDIPLSPQHGRDNAVISFIIRGPSRTESGDATEFERYARALEDMTTSRFDGRPHWGKANWANASSLAAAYGADAWGRFHAARAQADPHRVFGNEYLAQHLGA